jgi:beta-lactamase superfamily II metal-dependent hydrolase
VRIEIHDVDHGGCAVITGPQGHRLMLDCGLSLDRSWFPSVAYHGEHIDTLMLLNLDEDHCEDLAYLWNHCGVGAIVSNPTVSASALRAMKAEGGMRQGVTKAADILQAFGDGFIGNWSNELGGVQWHAYWNRFGNDFVDTNNLSLAAFVRFGSFQILFGGDLEKVGWRKLLQLSAFRTQLAATHVYVASHHGRENGCCDELFSYMRPELIVFSDGAKEHGTQETRDWYANRASGIPDYTKPAGIFGQPTRRVVTTRKDGTITINVRPEGRYIVELSKSSPAVRPTLASSFGMPPTLLGRRVPQSLGTV